MPSRLDRSNAGKSPQRWKDGWRLLAQIMPTLPGPSHCAVLWSCWFLAGLTKGGVTVFDATTTQIAQGCGLSPRSVERILRELTAGKVIATRKNGSNHGGRAVGAERCITWEPFQPPLVTVNISAARPSPKGEPKSADQKLTQLAKKPTRG